MNTVILCAASDAGVTYRYGRDTPPNGQPYRRTAATVCGHAFDIGPGDWLRVDAGAGYLLCSDGRVDVAMRTGGEGEQRVQGMGPRQFVAVTVGAFVTEAA